MVENNQPWWIYLIRMANGHLYCGVTIDIERRFDEHCSNTYKTAKALRNKGPLKLVYAHKLADKQEAMRLEYRLKQWPKMRKEQLINGQISFAELLNELNKGK